MNLGDWDHQLLDESVELVDDSNTTGQVKRGTLFVRGHLKRIGLHKDPSKRAGYYAHDENNDIIGLMTVVLMKQPSDRLRLFILP